MRLLLLICIHLNPVHLSSPQHESSSPPLSTEQSHNKTRKSTETEREGSSKRIKHLPSWRQYEDVDFSLLEKKQTNKIKWVYSLLCIEIMKSKKNKNNFKKRQKIFTHVCIWDTADASHYPSQCIYSHSLHSLCNKFLKKGKKKRRYSQVSRKEKQTINLLQHFAKTNWFADHMERVSKDKPASYWPLILYWTVHHPFLLPPQKACSTSIHSPLPAYFSCFPPSIHPCLLPCSLSVHFSVLLLWSPVHLPSLPPCHFPTRSVCSASFLSPIFPLTIPPSILLFSVLTILSSFLLYCLDRHPPIPPSILVYPTPYYHSSESEYSRYSST